MFVKSRARRWIEGALSIGLAILMVLGVGVAFLLVQALSNRDSTATRAVAFLVVFAVVVVSLWFVHRSARKGPKPREVGDHAYWVAGAVLVGALWIATGSSCEPSNRCPDGMRDAYGCT